MTSAASPPLIRKAPAKLNLALRVAGRRDDGFHEIDTLIVRLPELHDVLTFTPTDTGDLRLTCDDASLPVDDGNLVVRAARAFADAAKIAPAMRIHLEKRVPHGAGLGGGSSDAATTLLALQEIHGHPLSSERLAGLAAALGSDVPFFLQDGAARCTGRGEIVSPLESPPPKLPVLLLKPRFPVATADAYGRFAAAAAAPPISGVPATPPSLDGLEIRNDLERPVFQKHRFLAELKIWLCQRADIRAALLAGSGSTVAAILAPDADAAAIARNARHELDATLWHWHGLTG